MKKSFILLAWIVFAISIYANTGTIKLQSAPASVELTKSSNDGISVRYSLSTLNYVEVESQEGVWTKMSVPEYTTTNEIGMPALPLNRQLISVPVGASVHPRIVTATTQKIALSQKGLNFPLIPYQESVSKSDVPSRLPFCVNRDFYNGKNSTSVSTVKVEELGYIRGERIFALDFVPMSYNPDTKEIELIVSAQIDVSFDGADYLADKELKDRTFSPVFDSVLSNKLLNYNSTRLSLVRYPISYVIILPANFVTPMQPFIDWKKKEGFNVIVATTQVTGTTNTAIKAYMQNLWNSATQTNPAPSYLLIVGDIAQVPSTSGLTGTHPTDLPYVRLQGTDYMPELYFGRFSATTVAEVTNQVNKTLMHEQYTMPDDSYLANAVMIAGVDGTYATTHGNGQIRYGTQNYFNTAHGINSNTYLYPTSGNSASVTAIVSNVSSGTGYVNYTAHGDWDYWDNPRFNISNINNLQNTNKSSFVVGNCCLTSKFDESVCFAEAWLRASNKGAIIYIGGTNSTYWDEDYWWGVGAKGSANGNAPAYNAASLGAYDSVFHDNNEPFSSWASTAGGMVLAGNLAVVQGNSSRINYYWEIYSIMGDPSLIPYLGIPAVNNVQAPPTIFIGTSSIEVTAAPYSYVAISMNNVLYGAGLADANGLATIQITPFTEPGTASIVATRSLRRPAMLTASVVPNEGAYVTASQISVANNNGVAEAGTPIDMTITFSNLGILPAQNLNATISTTSPWVNLVNEQNTLNSIPAGQSFTAQSVFTAEIAEMTPDQHVAEFVITVTDGSSVWVSNRSVIVNAPLIGIASTEISDTNNDSIYESGETLLITVNIGNTGHMLAQGGTMNLVLNSQHASLNVNQYIIPNIAATSSTPMMFDLTLGNNVPDGTVITIGVAIDMGNRVINHAVKIPVGAVIEGFESGNFSSFSWVNTSNSPWVIVTNQVHTGTRSAKAGQIGHNANSVLQIPMILSANGEIRFWRKVSSEAGYDKLSFHINSNLMGSWSGDADWEEMVYPVAAGTHTFKWTYSKDGSYTAGSDTAWIDDIRFPVALINETAPIAYTAIQSLQFVNVLPQTTHTQSIALRNIGTAILNGTISTPTGFVLSNGETTLPMSYQYSIPAAGTLQLTLSYAAGATVENFSTNFMITTNDPNSTIINIPVSLTAGSDAGDIVSPFVTKLHKNYPNPFNPETTIGFSLKEASSVQITIYNMKGQIVKKLIDRDYIAGNHSIVWNGTDEQGKNVASGIYLYRMTNGNYSSSQKMMLMK